MWLIFVPVLTFISLATHDDFTKLWDTRPHPGCHWLYRERGDIAGMGGFAWPLKRTDDVLCWQDSVLTEPETNP